MTTCIYCGTGDNLTVQMTITLDGGEKVSVSACEEHAEDMTMRSARQKYLERQSEIDEIMAKAKALGLELAPQRTAGGIEIMQAVQKLAAPARQNTISPVFDDSDMIDAMLVERRERSIISSGGTAGNVHVESHQSLDMDKVREKIGTEVLEGKVRMEVIENSGGRAIAIPAKKINGLGATTIRIVPTSDNELQARFKHDADRSKSDSGWESMRHLGREGIRIINCPVCRTDGTIVDNGREVVCPKCKGRGMI